MFSQFKNTSEEHDAFVFKRAVAIALSTSFLMWVVKIYEWTAEKDLSYLGIFPRTLKGSIGILTAPLIHADIAHLLSNTVPFISLTLILFYFYSKKAIEIFTWIYITTGFWVWAFARPSYHIGASGIIYGIASFLLISGFLTKNIRLIAISLAVLFLYGGMFYGIVPHTVTENISWESHLLGAVSGFLLAIYFKSKRQVNKSIESTENATQIDTTASDPIHFVYHYKEKSKGDN